MAKTKITENFRKQVEYQDYPIPEFQKHPLVGALRPLPVDDVEIIERLSRFPTFNESDLSLPSMMRVLLPDRLKHFMFPMTQHVRIYKSLYAQIFDGYRHRNPVVPKGQKLLYGNKNKRKSTVSFLTGKSGVGKSSLIEAILESFGTQMIKHDFHGEDKHFTDEQIVYLKHNTPDQCTPKSVCQTVAGCVDDLTGKDEVKNLFYGSKSNRTTYMDALGKFLRHYHLGILIIDAFENISLASAGGRKQLAALIGNSRDDLGIPIFIVGTYEAANILNRNMSITRRFSEGGYFELEPPSGPDEEEWDVFCRIAWRYQWVRKARPFTDEIRDTLFDLSQGITGLMLIVFIKSQMEAINSGVEIVDAKMLKNVYQTQLQPMHDMIKALKSNTKSALARYEDLYKISAFKFNTSNRLAEMQKLMYEKQSQIQKFENAQKPKRCRKPKTNKRSVSVLRKLVESD